MFEQKSTGAFTKVNPAGRIGGDGGRIFPNVNGAPCAKTIPATETPGNIFLMSTLAAGLIDGEKMASLA